MRPVPPFDFLQLMDHLIRETILDDTHRITDRYGIRRDILCHYGPGSDHCTIADTDSPKDRHPKANPDIIADNNLVISYNTLAPGDLIFYSFEVNHRFLNISHVAIYAGDGYVIDASSSKGKVVYREIYDINKIVLCGRPYTN